MERISFLTPGEELDSDNKKISVLFIERLFF
jgi:hypothetical protein